MKKLIYIFYLALPFSALKRKPLSARFPRRGRIWWTGRIILLFGTESLCKVSFTFDEWNRHWRFGNPCNSDIFSRDIKKREKVLKSWRKLWARSAQCINGRCCPLNKKEKKRKLILWTYSEHTLNISWTDPKHTLNIPWRFEKKEENKDKLA